MIKVLNCIQSEHDFWLVVLASALCLTGAVVSLRLFRRGAESSESKYEWLVLAGITGGATIWSTHFIAMLAFNPTGEPSHSPSVTLFSLIVAILTTAVALIVSQAGKRWFSPEMGGLALGLGGCATHYVGMYAFAMPNAVLLWDSTYIAASILFAGLVGMVTMSVIVRQPMESADRVAAVLFTVCVAGLHFTGMTALTVVPLAAEIGSGHGLSDVALAVCVFLTSGFVFGAGLFVHSIDRRSKLTSARNVSRALRHDPLTGLPNRKAFEEELDRLIESAHVEGRELAIHLVNIARFNEVNDSLGDNGGDIILKELSRRLSMALGNRTFVARLSGTHFATISEHHDFLDERDRAEAIRDCLSSTFAANEKQFKVAFDIGVALFPRDGFSRRALMAKADVALERARRSPGNRICFYDDAMDREIRRRRILAQDLQCALEQNQLEMFFQPQRELRSMEACGFEGLLRWRHPQFGMVSPAEFIPIAEETGLIGPMGEWVLKEGCKLAATWAKPCKVALNVSPIQLRSMKLGQVVLDALRSSGLAVDRLELEVTESAVIDGASGILEELRFIKSLGVAVSLDDFGSGYSSLATLSSFPFDKIKLDKSFLDESRPRTHAEAIVAALLTMGRKLGMKILVEGVETEEQLFFLRTEGCDQAQGYVIGKPMPAADVDAWIAADSKDASRKTHLVESVRVPRLVSQT